MAQQNKLGHRHTAVVDTHGYLRVVYHETEVVKYSREKIVLDSGEWRSSTTKTRMNQAANQFGLNFRVYAVKGEWFVEFRNKIVPFKDGMVLERR